MIDRPISNVCPACGLPLNVGQERVAARDQGRVREFHSECVRRTQHGRRSVEPVGRGLEAIFGERPEQ